MKLNSPLFFSLLTLGFSLGCQKAETSETKFFWNNDPQVSSMALPNQDQWLAGRLPESANGVYQRVVGFGDSLSDTGNLNRNTLGIYVNKKTYWEGRWSNGPVWMEYVAKALGATLNNYSVGAAETREKAAFGPERIVIPGLGRQIDQFLRDDKDTNTNKKGTLVAMWIGSNNYLFAGNDDPEQTVADIRQGLEKLIARGFVNFAIGRVGDLSSVTGTGKTSEQLALLGPAHNRFLDIALAELKVLHPEIRLMDFHSETDTVDQVTDLSLFEFRNVSTPCYVGDLQGNFTGEKKFCEDYMGNRLWDSVHPNTKAHCYYAVRLLQDIGIEVDRAALIGRCQELDPRH